MRSNQIIQLNLSLDVGYSQPIWNTNNRSGYFKSPSVYQMKCFIRRWKRFKYGLPESNSPLTFLKDFVRFVSFSHSLILHRKLKSIPRSIYIYRFLFVVNVNMSIEQIYGHQYTITRHSNHSIPIHVCVCCFSIFLTFDRSWGAALCWVFETKCTRFSLRHAVRMTKHTAV